MFHFLLLVLVFYPAFILTDDTDVRQLGDDLVSELKVDENLDLSIDEEYEDLRSEFLAYHTTLKHLLNSRRSFISTPCANVGGICINYNLCPGYRQLTEVPGCKNQLNVCCFVYNIYNVRDQREHGIGNIAFPWNSLASEFGGKGVEEKEEERHKKKKKKELSKKSILYLK